jgi:cytochrome c-type biogenesis protein CcmF
VNQAGVALLAIAALASLAALVFSLGGEFRRSHAWTTIGHYSVYAILGSSAVASLVLLAAFLSRDFGNAYVFEHSSKALSIPYTISAVWAGNAGSLLLWLLLLAVFMVIGVRAARRRDRSLAGLVTAVLSAMTLFFSLLVLFGPQCNPFIANSVSPTPQDGLGLNPQLQNPGMIIHPLALYAGYVAMAVPFALLLAGLAKKLPLTSWLGSVRTWVLVGWLFLTIGNVVGAWWAYVTLGWGGYWAWDPVENASLIPWLTATALLHATSMARRRNKHKFWMAWLVAITFLLTVFGTFLTRSGFATSVHAFAEPGLVPWFTTFMAVMFVAAFAVIVWRFEMLRGDPSLTSGADETATFLYTNIVLSVMTFVILWGVIFPPIANAVSSNKVELGTKFFNVVTAPLGLIVLAVLVLCMLVRVARGDWRRLGFDLGFSAGFGIVVLAVLLALGVRKGYPVAAFALSATAIAAVVIATARTGLGWKRRRSYGTILIHVGLAILIIGLAGSWTYKTSTEGQLTPGRSLALGDAKVTFVQITSGQRPDKEVTSAVLDLSLDGKPAGQLAPSLEYYPAGDQTWTRVARRSSVEGDIYITLLAVTPADKTVDIRMEAHPLIVWLWVGGGVMAFGALVALILGRRPSGAKGGAAGKAAAPAEPGAPPKPDPSGKPGAPHKPGPPGRSGAPHKPGPPGKPGSRPKPATKG